MTFWIPTSRLSSALWLTVYFIAPIVFNVFNVRRYGEFEFWLTSIKVITCVGLIILGMLLLMGASTAPLLLGTSPDHRLIQCTDPLRDNCVALPGFNCIILHK